ncbi:MAG TPA: hypothetical protein VK550_14915 [Polyangiaceae bacterium]|nr:hypothetical protein [Polyangiaceae bacterium]
MKKHCILAAAALGLCTLGVTPANAQSRETVTTTGPNRELLHSGIFALGVPYVASVIVAASSDRSEDKHLYIPVAGPWMDYANRGGCGHLGEPSCDTETAYKVLLIGNGILQGVGALEIIGSFLFPQTRTVSATSNERRVVVTPYYTGNSYGLSTFARF